MFAREPDEQRLQGAFDDELVERPLDGDRPSPHDGSALGDGLDQTAGRSSCESKAALASRRNESRTASICPSHRAFTVFWVGLGSAQLVCAAKIAIAAFSMRSSGMGFKSISCSFPYRFPYAFHIPMPPSECSGSSRKDGGYYKMGVHLYRLTCSVVTKWRRRTV